MLLKCYEYIKQLFMYANMYIVTRIAGIIEVPVDSYAMPIVYAIGGILVTLALCLICQRRLQRRSRSGMPIDELPPVRIIDDRRHCYHHDLLHHSHHQQDHMSTRSFNQYQLEQPSPPSESDEGEEVEEIDQGCDQETSSPDSV